MEKLSPVLNGNDAITLASYHNVRDELHTSVETKNLIQFSKIDSVTFKPLFTAKSLRGFSKMALEFKMTPQYYVDVPDENDLSTIVPYRVLETKQEDEKKVIKTPLIYTYVLNGKELIDGISSGLYEDFDLFKSRLDNELVNERARRSVPVEVETTLTPTGNPVTAISDLTHYAQGSAEDETTSFDNVVKSAFEKIHEAYMDDVAKAEIEARQHARDLEAAKAPVVQKTADELFTDEETKDNSLEDGYIDALAELHLEASDDDAAKVLEGLTLDDVSTVDNESAKQTQSLSYDAGSDDEIIRALQEGLEEDEFVAPATSDEARSAEIQDLLDEEEAEPVSTPKQSVKISKDDELSLS